MPNPPSSERDERAEDASTIGTSVDKTNQGAQASLRIVQDTVVTSQVLPEIGDLVIGRSRKANVFIDHASISRKHALLHVGPTMWIRDLGSANGTRVGERRVEQGEEAAVRAGEVIKVGSVILVVQGRGELERPGEISPARPEPPVSAIADEAALRGQLQALEHDRIIAALAQCAGNQTQAAKLLGISRGTLVARLESFGIRRPRKKVD